MQQGNIPLPGSGAPRPQGEAPSRWRAFLSMQRIAPAVVVLAGLAALLELWRRGLPLWDETGPGPSFFPALLSAVLLVLGVILWLSPDEAPAADTDDPQGYVAPSQTLKFSILLAGLIIAFPHLGGLLALALFVFAEMLWVERSSIAMALASGVAAFALIWLLFVWLLSVPLPSGILPMSLS